MNFIPLKAGNKILEQAQLQYDRLSSGTYAPTTITLNHSNSRLADYEFRAIISSHHECQSHLKLDPLDMKQITPHFCSHFPSDNEKLSEKRNRFLQRYVTNKAQAGQGFQKKVSKITVSNAMGSKNMKLVLIKLRSIQFENPFLWLPLAFVYFVSHRIF